MIKQLLFLLLTALLLTGCGSSATVSTTANGVPVKIQSASGPITIELPAE